MLLFSLGCGPQPIVPNRCTGPRSHSDNAEPQVDAVGKARAKELIYTARVVRAEEAREIGIVQAVVRRTTIIAGRCCLWGPWPVASVAISLPRTVPLAPYRSATLFRHTRLGFVARADWCWLTRCPRQR